MSLSKYFYRRDHMDGVQHTTLNPKGPGCVRIHLVPPKPSLRPKPSVVILNGRDVIPLNPSWAILLNEFIRDVNYFAGRPLTDDDLKMIINGVVLRVHQLYPKADLQLLKDDLKQIVTCLVDIAQGRQPSIDVGYMSLGDYAPYMRAPHRMDLMVSAMTQHGKWHCNQKCLHCYAAGQTLAETPELSTDEWKKILDDLQKIGVPQVTFTGGEPTLRKDLPELVDHAQWFVTRLNTNGVLMTPQLCQELYQASLDSVQITFYSHRADIHNSLVGAENYTKTLQGIDNALAAGLNVSVNTPLCTHNSDYVRTLHFLYAHGVRYVTCSGLITTGNACSTNSAQTRLSGAQMYDSLYWAADYCAAHDMEISFTSPGWLKSETLSRMGLTVPTCGACLSNMAITPDGNVVPCQSWLDDGASLGRFSAENWKKIWNSRACKEKRAFSAQCSGVCPLRK